MVTVLWAMAVAAMLAAAIQLFAYRQAVFGREAVARIQARWAARGGIEHTIAIMADHSINPVPNHAFAMVRDFSAVSEGKFLGATYTIRHNKDGRSWLGPLDEHSKLNLNTETSRAILPDIEGMTLDIIDALTDWTDENDEVSAFGVERDYYLGLPHPIEPRNGPLRTTAELEMIAGIWPELYRGEDWNLNGRLDSNENDGLLSMPEDEPDGILDTGWSGKFTVYSRGGGATDTGLPRIHLSRADPAELVERLKINEEQALALINFGSNNANDIATLILQPLSQLGGGSGTDLDDDQLRLVFSETSILDPTLPQPGKMNINTISEDLLWEVLANEDHALVEEILYLRNSREEGIASILDYREFLDPPDIANGQITLLAQLFDVRSNVYTISAQGRSPATGLEVEIIMVVDRSTIPVTILEYREE